MVRVSFVINKGNVCKRIKAKKKIFVVGYVIESDMKLSSEVKELGRRHLNRWKWWGKRRRRYIKAFYLKKKSVLCTYLYGNIIFWNLILTNKIYEINETYKKNTNLYYLYIIVVYNIFESKYRFKTCIIYIIKKHKNNVGVFVILNTYLCNLIIDISIIYINSYFGVKTTKLYLNSKSTSWSRFKITEIKNPFSRTWNFIIYISAII